MIFLRSPMWHRSKCLFYPWKLRATSGIIPKHTPIRRPKTLQKAWKRQKNTFEREIHAFSSGESSREVLRRLRVRDQQASYFRTWLPGSRPPPFKTGDLFSVWRKPSCSLSPPLPSRTHSGTIVQPMPGTVLSGRRAFWSSSSLGWGLPEPGDEGFVGRSNKNLGFWKDHFSDRFDYIPRSAKTV